MKLVTITWRCDIDSCPVCVTVEVKPEDGSFDLNYTHPPDGLLWHREGDVEQILCEEHHKEWDEKVSQKNPNAVWLA